MVSRCRGGVTPPYVAHNRFNTINAPSSKFVALETELETSAKSIISLVKTDFRPVCWEAVPTLHFISPRKTSEFL